MISFVKFPRVISFFFSFFLNSKTIYTVGEGNATSSGWLRNYKSNWKRCFWWGKTSLHSDLDALNQNCPSYKQLSATHLRAAVAWALDCTSPNCIAQPFSSPPSTCARLNPVRGQCPSLLPPCATDCQHYEVHCPSFWGGSRKQKLIEGEPRDPSHRNRQSDRGSGSQVGAWRLHMNPSGTVCSLRAASWTALP